MAIKKADFTELEFLLERDIFISKRRIYLDDDVTDIASIRLIKQLHYLEAQSTTQPIHFYISTFGGSIYDGMAIYDAMLRCEAPIYTYATGKVMSMGTFLLIAGDIRYSDTNATIMVHEPSDYAHGQLEDIKIAAREAERLAKTLVEIYVEHTGIKDRKYWEGLKKDTYFNAEKALEMGMIDEIY